jgi:rubrerythrin
MKRNFTSLNPQEALHVAIFIEERNAELYHRLAEMFVEFRDSASLEIAGVFCEMAAEEKEHSSKLQSRYMEQYGSCRCALTEEDLVELIEVPRLEQVDLFAASEVSKVRARDRALQVALNAEDSAQRYYATLVEKTEPGPLRQLYRELNEIEGDHVAAIEQKMSAHPAKDARGR